MQGSKPGYGEKLITVMTAEPETLANKQFLAVEIAYNALEPGWATVKFSLAS
ncbi:MAG: hypothetical protein Fur0046_05100 [Cyanobacteria bacterium J069]